MTNMTNARVIQLIEAYGPEPGAWPDAERDAAEALLRAHPDIFAEALGEARALDVALSDLPEPVIPAGLAERIIASAPATKPHAQAGILSGLRSMVSIGGKLWPSAAAMASSAFGLMIGYGALGTTQVADADIVEEAVYAAFEEPYAFDIGDMSQ